MPYIVSCFRATISLYSGLIQNGIFVEAVAVFGAKRTEKSLISLKPFLLKLKEGHLLGVALDPGKGSPCAKCFELWLKSRNVWAEPVDLSDLRVKRELIAELLAENNPHVCYEIASDGTQTRMDNAVFPHPDCICDRNAYVGPVGLHKKTNFAFSPLLQIKCARFGTPDGNLWLTSTYGESPLSKKTITVCRVDQEKEQSRQLAVTEWMKQAALSDLDHRVKSGEGFSAEVFQTGDRVLAMSHKISCDPLAGTMGAGKDRDEATLDALVSLAKQRTLKQYSSAMKNPMLVVGANNWLRTRVPFFLLQQYDLHLLFYPNSMQAWVVGLAAFSRQRVDEKPIFVFGANVSILHAINEVIYRIVAACRPQEWTGEPAPVDEAKAAQARRLNMWWTHWIYRCSKIALKDVLHLESYGKSLDEWRNYFRDGQDPFAVISVNHSLLPAEFRNLVKIQLGDAEAMAPRRIGGIATWSDFREALT